MSEQVNHPSHYNTGKIEVIDAIEDWKLGFNAGNAVKYIARHQHKGASAQDLKKALWYIARELVVAQKMPTIDLISMIMEIKKTDVQKDIDELMRTHQELFGTVPSAPFLKGSEPLMPMPPFIASSEEKE